MHNVSTVLITHVHVDSVRRCGAVQAGAKKGVAKQWAVSVVAASS